MPVDLFHQKGSPEVIEGNRFLAARACLQRRYLGETEDRFADLVRTRLPRLDRDVSELSTLRAVSEKLYGEEPNGPGR
ncbi:MAG: hypothetical protein HZB53_15440 [Chloroflexi bacterium]|nr:hypothetical protein [Chloroflexota bacterium]